MSKHGDRTLAKGPLISFLCFSILGIFVFFVQVPIGGSVSIPIDHLTAFLKRVLNPYYAVILTVLAGLSVLSRFHKKAYQAGKGQTDALFFVLSLVGWILSLAAVLRLLPGDFGEAVDSAAVATGNILCAIFVTSLFIPFLTEYGLVDFFGILCKPFMRKLFLTPGSSAVIGVSAFLGNYSVGHIISRRMYDAGEFTEKESVIVATGFSTCSIGLMLNLVNYTGLTQYWHLYVATVLLVTFVTTAIVARIYPICRKRATNDAGVLPEDDVPKDHLFRAALHAAVSRAEHAVPPAKAALVFLRQTLPLICEIAGASMCVVSIGMWCANSTQIFQIVGAIVYPLLRLVGLNGADASLASACLGASLLEPVLAGVINGGSGQTLAKWIVSVVPYAGIIFFAGSIPSLYKSGISCNIRELLVIWLERVVIGIFLTALLCYLAGWVGLLPL